MINGFSTIINNAQHAPALFGGVPMYIDVSGVVYTEISDAGLLSLKTYLESNGWKVVKIVPDSTNRAFLHIIVIGNTSDNLEAVASAMEDIFNGFANTLYWAQAKPYTDSTLPTVPTGTTTTGGVSPTSPKPKTDKSLDDYLKELGSKIGFSPTSALIGGAAIIGIAAIILLKKS